jgi:hypothetical protein
VVEEEIACRSSNLTFLTTWARCRELDIEDALLKCFLEGGEDKLAELEDVLPKHKARALL